MKHFDAFVRWTAALLLTVLSIACGKDKTTTTEGPAITGGSWGQTETIEAEEGDEPTAEQLAAMEAVDEASAAEAPEAENNAEE